MIFQDLQFVKLIPAEVAMSFTHIETRIIQKEKSSTTKPSVFWTLTRHHVLHSVSDTLEYPATTVE